MYTGGGATELTPPPFGEVKTCKGDLIPPGMSNWLRPSLVQVLYTPLGTGPTTIYQLDTFFLHKI